MSYEGKVVIVTGAASGIGKATAEWMAREGASLILGDLNEAGLKAVAAGLQAKIAPVVLAYDQGDPKSCADFMAKAVAAHGRLDMLCNIAGMMEWSPVGEYSAERFDRIVRVNLAGVFNLSHAAARHLIESKGNIVNVASSAGLVGIAYASAYSATKHGVVGLTRSMAVELAHQGVRVNAICPTGVNTPMIQQAVFPEGADVNLIMRSASKLGGVVEPEEIAAAIGYLGSDMARQISGVSLPIDGAQTIG